MTSDPFLHHHRIEGSRLDTEGRRHAMAGATSMIQAPPLQLGSRRTSSEPCDPGAAGSGPSDLPGIAR